MVAKFAVNCCFYQIFLPAPPLVLENFHPASNHVSQFSVSRRLPSRGSALHQSMYFFFNISIHPNITTAFSAGTNPSLRHRGIVRYWVEFHPKPPSKALWRHQMETFSALLALYAGNSPVTGEIPSQRPVTRSFDVFIDLRLNKRLIKQSKRQLFETPSHPL